MIQSLLRVLAGLLLAVTAPASAVEASDWRHVDAKTGQIRDVIGLEKLAQDFPDSGTVRLRLLQPYIEAGEYEKAMTTLEWLYERGYVFSEVAQQQIPRLLEGVDPGRIAERLRAEAEVIEASEIKVVTPADVGLAESVLRDPVDDRLIVTSVSERAVFGRRGTGGWDGVRFEDAGNLSGIALAPGSRTIWIASGSIDGSDSGEGFRGLIGMDHDNNQEIRIEAPDGVSFSDIVAVEGEVVFASDPISGGVYRIDADKLALQELVARGTFRSPQGLAVSADGARLYVSDYRYGVAIVDLGSGDISRLTTNLPLILDGIDGMWLHKNELIVVQNGTSPLRIAAFKLSEDGMSVIDHRILEQAHTQWTEPLSGSIDEGKLLYVGNGQWDRFVAGEQAQDKPPLPTQIRSLSLTQ